MCPDGTYWFAPGPLTVNQPGGWQSWLPWAAVLVVSAVALLFLFLVYKVRHPSRSAHCPSGIDGVEHPSDLGWPVTEHRIEVDESVRLSSWFVPSEIPSEATVLLLHGHRKNKRQMLCHGQYLRRAGYNLLFVDLRHHGESDDAPMALGAYARKDLARVVEWLKAEYPARAKRVAAFGLSLGATTAMAAALDGAAFDAVIADSPSADQAETMADYGWILYRVPRPLSRLFLVIAATLAGVDFSCLKTAERLEGSRLPLLVLHGEADSRVPVAHGRRLASTQPGNRRKLVLFEGADHVQAYRLAPGRYEKAVLDFLAAYVPVSKGDGA